MILQHMFDRKLNNFRDFTKIINLYYREPETVKKELGIR